MKYFGLASPNDNRIKLAEITGAAVDAAFSNNFWVVVGRIFINQEPSLWPEIYIGKTTSFPKRHIFSKKDLAMQHMIKMIFGE